MHQIPVFSVIGYSGMGKTTFLENLLPCLKRCGMRVCVIKHDVHGFEVDREGKDSWRMTQAGADMTILSGSRQSVIFENRPMEPEKLLESVHDVDLVLTEGYKTEPWPKIALYRETVGKPFPCPMEECAAIVTDAPIETQAPCFAFQDTEAIAKWILKQVREKNGTESF